VKKYHNSFSTDVQFPISATRLENPLRKSWLYKHKKSEQIKAKTTRRLVSRSTLVKPGEYVIDSDSEEPFLFQQVTEDTAPKGKGESRRNPPFVPEIEDTQLSWTSFDSNITSHQQLRKEAEESYLKECMIQRICASKGIPLPSATKRVPSVHAGTNDSTSTTRPKAKKGKMKK